MSKRALVASGGGSKGAFSVGAVSYLAQEKGLSFDFLVGTSTGSLIAPMVLVDQIDLLETLYTNVTTADILQPRTGAEIAGGASSFFETSPLWGKITANITEARAQTILAHDAQLAIATVNLASSKLVFHHSGASLEVGYFEQALPLTSADHLRRAVLASCDQPVIMPPVEVPAGSGQKYVDGGLRAISAIELALRNGCDEVYVVLPSPYDPPTRPGSYETFWEVGPRALTIMLEEIQLNELRASQLQVDAARYLNRLREYLGANTSLDPTELGLLFQAASGAPNPFAEQQPVTLHVIQPEHDLGMDTLSFDIAQMKAAMQTGRQRAQALVP